MVSHTQMVFRRWKAFFFPSVLWIQALTPWNLTVFSNGLRFHDWFAMFCISSVFGYLAGTYEVVHDCSILILHASFKCALIIHIIHSNTFRVYFGTCLVAAIVKYNYYCVFTKRNFQTWDIHCMLNSNMPSHRLCLYREALDVIKGH